MSYIFLTQFVLRDKCASFPCKGNDSSFVKTECHVIISISNENGSMTDCRSVQPVSELTVRKMLIAPAKQKYLECLRVTKVTNECINNTGPKDSSLRNTRKHFKGCRVHTVDSNTITTSHANYTTDIPIRQPAGTELK
jgi:hypothetical protein